jgi:hypothetical protein
MADDGSARTKQRSLQQAASVIFAIVAVVPLLILAWTLHALGAIRSPEAQFALALALGISLLGFWMFRSLLSRMAGRPDSHARRRAGWSGASPGGDRACGPGRRARAGRGRWRESGGAGDAR